MTKGNVIMGFFLILAGAVLVARVVAGAVTAAGVVVALGCGVRIAKDEEPDGPSVAVITTASDDTRPALTWRDKRGRQRLFGGGRATAEGLAVAVTKGRRAGRGRRRL